MKLPVDVTVAFAFVKISAYVVLIAAVFCLPPLALLSSDNGPAALLPLYLVSLAGLLCWCLLFLRSEALLARWGLAAAIASACLACFAYLTVVERHLRSRAGISRYNAPNACCERSNQAMQLTASKLSIYLGGVRHREHILCGMHRGLAAADLVSR